MNTLTKNERAIEVTKALFEADFTLPVQFDESLTSGDTSLVWNHPHGRITIYVESNGTFSIEEIPARSIFAVAELTSIAEVLQIMERYQFLKASC